MADPIHVHTQFDPAAKVHSLVEELEREALDEEMVRDICRKMANTLMSRAERSQQIITERIEREVKERRSERLRAKEKGVEAQPWRPKHSVLQTGLRNLLDEH